MQAVSMPQCGEARFPASTSGNNPITLSLEKVHGDLVGPFLMSEGCKYILVLINTATRFCWLQAMSEITAAGVAQEMLHIFSEFGWPSTLVMDGGLNMSKAAVANILALVGAEARVTIPGAVRQAHPSRKVLLWASCHGFLVLHNGNVCVYPQRTKNKE